MARYSIEQETLTGIANAIRNKTGKSDSIVVNDMATEIEGIQSGGDSTIENGIIEGTISTFTNKSATIVGSYAFYNNGKIENLSFLSASIIGERAFGECSRLKSVDFPMATTISYMAFYKCSRLTNISFPNVTNISSSAFYSCSGLTSIYFPNVQTIGSSAFALAYKISYAAFDKVTDIRSNAFYRNDSLATFICGASSVCQLHNSNAFTSTKIASGTGYIYVPSSLVDSYKIANNWSYFSNQISAIEDM